MMQGTAQAHIAQLIESTMAHFTAAGFQTIEPEPLLPRDDPSLLLNNSAVVAFKRYLRGACLPSTGVAVVQPCVRAHWLSDLTGSSGMLSSFVMVGAFTGTTALPNMKAMLQHFWPAIGIPLSRVRVLLSERDQTLYQAVTNPSGVAAIVPDSKPSDFYEWTFGMPGVSGRGATFAIVQSDGSERYVANLIHITGPAGPLGFGFGMGVEAAIWAREGLPTLALAASISDIWSVAEARQARLADLLALAVLCYRHGVAVGRSRQGYVLKKTLKAIAKLQVELGRSTTELCTQTAAYEAHVYGAKQLTTPRLWADIRRLGQHKRAPGVRRDVSFLVLEHIAPTVLEDAMRTALGNAVRKVDLFDMYQGQSIPSGFQALTYRLELEVKCQAEATSLVQAMAAQMHREFGAQWRGAATQGA